jgi:hypothetical protein
MILLWCDLTYSNTTGLRRNYKKHEVIFNRLNRLAMLTSPKQEHSVSCAFQANVPPLNGLFANIMHKIAIRNVKGGLFISIQRVLLEESH